MDDDRRDAFICGLICGALGLVLMQVFAYLAYSELQL